MSISPERLAAILAKARANKPQIFGVENDSNDNTISNTVVRSSNNLHNSERDKDLQAQTTTEILEIPTNNPAVSIDKYGHTITLNAKQSEAVELAAKGESLVLIGAAGSGKTTTTRAIIQRLIETNIAGVMTNTKHKYLKDNTPGIVCVSYTRRAVANLKKALPADLAANCLSIHKLLQYEPVYDTVIDPETGKESTKMQFIATRNASNPLPSCIHTIIVDESSMESVELHNEIVAACPHNPQFIFLGDIQQLPPVFGSAILGFKMLELPTIELTEIYRQALESPIIRLAHRILSGEGIPAKEFADWKVPQQLTIHPWKKKLDADLALLTTAKFFTSAIDAGAYNPDEDMVLIPFNKSLGTIELNKYIAQHLAIKRGSEVWEVIAGFNKHYFSVGDKVLVDKEDAVIIGIKPNPQYLGVTPTPASTTLDYWGAEQGEMHHIAADISEMDVDAILEAAANGDSEDRVRQCSHIITVRMVDSELDVEIKTASDVNSMLLGYCLTVHKSQGSEWRKVFIVLHQSHATMLQRELLYTAVTRAREELYIICEPESLMNGVKSQRIKGNTLAEKAEWFKGKVESGYLDK